MRSRGLVTRAAGRRVMQSRENTSEGDELEDVLALVLGDLFVRGQELGAVVVQRPHVMHQIHRVCLLLALLIDIAVKLDAIPRMPDVRSALDLCALEPAEVGEQDVGEVLEQERAVAADATLQVGDPHDVALPQRLAALDLGGVSEVLHVLVRHRPAHNLGNALRELVHALA
eukprot:CAMPEP_0181339670 /NCGR_PEP_ID=MMETSP1101-20121128/29404_1 /TAXON_ID=46948 /ORGANISM="Rhodomonas abbreviata, Strain Caron Lab Isolate" /LENGTH=171 /DNA_ID=CAMNT_0023450703 /DNA_START=187 /DNA_END=699 /DNA_ORIENTATION=+